MSKLSRLLWFKYTGDVTFHIFLVFKNESFTHFFFLLTFALPISAQTGTFGNPVKISHELSGNESIFKLDRAGLEPYHFIELAPSNQRLAYMTSENGKINALFATDVQSGESKKLSKDVSLNESIVRKITFSQNGENLLYFTKTSSSEKTSMFVVSIRDGGPVFIDELSNESSIHNAVFSPDGEAIYYAKEIDQSTNTQAFYKFSISGQSKQLIKIFPETGIIQKRKLSADGSWYVFSLNNKLYSLNTSGASDPVLLSEPHPQYNWSLTSFSNDGTLIAYAKQIGVNLIEPGVTEPEYSLSLHKVDGSEEKTIETDEVMDYGGRFSPDGKFLAYRVGNNGGTLSTSDLMIYDIEKGTTTTTNDASGSGIHVNEYQFSDDSTMVVYTLRGSTLMDGVYSTDIIGQTQKLLSKINNSILHLNTQGEIVTFTQFDVSGRNEFYNKLTGDNLKNLGPNFLGITGKKKLVVSESTRFNRTTYEVKPVSDNESIRLNLHPSNSMNIDNLQGTKFLRVIPNTDILIYAGDFETKGVFEIFSLDLEGIEFSESLCVPIKSQNAKLTTVCL